MSTDYKVPYTTILDIQPHGNADKLVIATIYGFQVIVQKDKYQKGDQIVYVPIDSLLPKWLEDILFSKDSKVILRNSRVRQIKLRGRVSQGLVVDPKDISSKVNPEYLKPEQDLAAILGIVKYEPPVPGAAFMAGTKSRDKKGAHVLFHQYNGVNNIKWMPDYFKEGEIVEIQCKLHGTNARVAVLPFIANTFWKKVKKFLRLVPKTERCYGSNRVDISSSYAYQGFYGEDIYGTCFNTIKAFDKIKEGEIVYGEIVGPGIQKNYTYGLNEHHFVVFDVKIRQFDGKFKWLNPGEVESFCKEREFEHIPVLYRGPYNKELAYSLTKGPSAYNPVQKIREGIVIKAAKDCDMEGNKRALKWVSEDYLSDPSNTDNH
jgi:RNA ligase (TIGR02306 family)